ncbi:MAG: single-stranded DNA-binding protein [Akkermansiaceae bacterium]|nr:single-stranded DNA-binding protein [Armatimonadota bacterium]
MNYNRIILIGRMVNDPELKYTPSGIAVTQFRLAVNRPLSSEARSQGTQEQADFIDISTWRQSAEYAAQYLNKGRLVLVEGRLQIRDYVDKEGQKRKAAEVVADTVKGLDRREQGEGDAAASGGGGQQYARSGGNAQYGGGGGGEYDQTPREAAPVAAPANRSAGGGGSYNGGSSAPRPAAPNRNAPPANNYNDNADGFDDPFAE